MSHLIPKTRKARKNVLYSREEVVVLSKYKSEYKDRTTKPLRAHVLRNKILVDIVNYWDAEGTLPVDEETCIQWVKVTCFISDFRRDQQLTQLL
jgi:hypothetical protein